MPVRGARRGRRDPPGALVLALLWLTPAVVGAQVAQYTSPGQFDLHAGSEQERIDGAIQEARWQVGRVYINPWLSLRDIAWVNDFGSENVLGERPQRRRGTDFTASFGAGLRAYLPVGSGLSLAAHALPEYAWWQEREERRRLNGRLGLGLFGSAGRTSVEATVTRDDGIRFFSREFEERVNQRRERASFEIGISLVGAFSFFGQAESSRHRVIREGQEELLQLAALDRDETRYTIGGRYRFVRGLQVGLGFQVYEAEFENRDDLRATEGEAVVLTLRHGGPLWSMSALVASQSLEIGRGPGRRQDDRVRGNIRANWAATTRFGVQLFADRNRAFSFQAASPFFDDTRYGIGLRTNLGSRVNARIFVEAGDLSFASFDRAGAARADDFEAFGGDVFVALRGVRFGVGATRTKYDSSLPQFDRSVTVSRLFLSFTRQSFGLGAIGTGGVTIGTGELSPWT